jgi:hypothetical protein
MRDILAELAAGTLSEADAERIYEELMDSRTAYVPELLGISKEEWTAFTHGVGFTELSAWRHGGWPVECRRCRRAIDVARFGWLAKEVAPGRHVLQHVSCASA